MYILYASMALYDFLEIVKYSWVSFCVPDNDDVEPNNSWERWFSIGDTGGSEELFFFFYLLFFLFML